MNTCFGRKPRGQRELRVYGQDHYGHKMLEIRLWEQGAGGTWGRTRKGIALHLRELRFVKKAITAAIKEAVRDGHIKPAPRN